MKNSKQSVENKLIKFFQIQKSMKVEYDILLTIQEAMEKDKLSPKSQQIISQLYAKLSPDIRTTAIYEKISYKLWLNEQVCSRIRQQTRFFQIIFNWIVKFELRVGKLATIEEQFLLIVDFLTTNTNTLFQRFILVNEVYEDLKELIDQRFWKLQAMDLKKEDYKAIIGLLDIIVSYAAISFKQQPFVYINKTLENVSYKNYTQFVFQCIQFLFAQNLPENFQKDLASITLVFLHEPLIKPQIYQIVRMLMKNTTKAVKYALYLQFIQFYEFVEKSDYDVLDKIQSILSFRELIIHKSENTSPEPLRHPLSSLWKQVVVKPRSKHRIYLTNETLLQNYLKLEIEVENGDINVNILYAQGQYQVVFEQYERIQNKNHQIRLSYTGLYVVQLDNSYSWINSKTMKYKVDQFHILATQIK